MLFSISIILLSNIFPINTLNSNRITLIINNKKVKFVVVGYFEKEYKDTINISIKEINDKIEITTKR